MIEDIGINHKSEDKHVLEHVYEGNQLEPNNIRKELNEDIKRDKEDMMMMICDSSEDSILTD